MVFYEHRACALNHPHLTTCTTAVLRRSSWYFVTLLLARVFCLGLHRVFFRARHVFIFTFGTMTSFRFRNKLNLTDEELLWLHDNDDSDQDVILSEDEASDVENNDHLSDHEEVDDQIHASEYEEVIFTEEDLIEQIDEPYQASAGVPFYSAKDGTQWSKIPVSKYTRRSESNKIVIRPGLTARSSAISSVKEAFLLFFSTDIIEIIVNETNRKAQHFFAEYNAANPNDTRRYAPTNKTEIEAYIGLLISLGALQSNTEPIELLYTSDPAYCRPIVPASLSRNRYKFLTKFLRFDNFETRAERKLTDKLAPIRDIFDILVSNCKGALNPSPHMCIDEQLVPFRGKAPFRVYMKSKPAKYGIKIWALADCEHNYTLNMQVYLGKLFCYIIVSLYYLIFYFL